MKMSFHTLNCPAVVLGNVNKNKTQYRTRSNPSAAAQISSATKPTDESGKSFDSKRVSGSAIMAIKRYQASNSLLSQPNTVGIIGGVSVFSTLIFLEKLVRWSYKDGQECVPFVVCNDPGLSKEIDPVLSSFHSFKSKNSQIQFNHGPIVGNLQQKRMFLEQSGACCIVMPCHVSHAWHAEISKGCSLPFLHIGECVANELSKANMKPLEAGSSNVRIGVLATDSTSVAAFYQEKLQSQARVAKPGDLHNLNVGFEVVLPDEGTMQHIVIPANEALNRRDIEGARNLLRIAIQILLVRAVNTVVIASDEMQGLLPHDDPLLKKCIDPLDSLARSTLKWTKSIQSDFESFIIPER